MIISVLGQNVVNFSNLKKIEVRDVNPCLETSQDVDRRIIWALSLYRFFFGVEVGASWLWYKRKI